MARTIQTSRILCASQSDAGGGGGGRQEFGALKQTKKNLRVLMVEDNNMVANSNKRIISAIARKLEKEVELVEAVSARGVTNMLEDTPSFDLILLDLRDETDGGGGDIVPAGIELINLLVKKEKTDVLNAIIITTGSPTDLDNAPGALKAVGRRVLHKPFSNAIELFKNILKHAGEGTLTSWKPPKEETW